MDPDTCPRHMEPDTSPRHMDPDTCPRHMDPDMSPRHMSQTRHPDTCPRHVTQIRVPDTCPRYVDLDMSHRYVSQTHGPRHVSQTHAPDSAAMEPFLWGHLWIFYRTNGRGEGAPEQGLNPASSWRAAFCPETPKKAAGKGRGKKRRVVRGTSHHAWGVPAPLLQLPIAAVTHLGHAVLEVLQRVLVPRAVPADDLGETGARRSQGLTLPAQAEDRVRPLCQPAPTYSRASCSEQSYYAPLQVLTCFSF